MLRQHKKYYYNFWRFYNLRICFIIGTLNITLKGVEI
jgi:hypothetical protein